MKIPVCFCIAALCTGLTCVEAQTAAREQATTRADYQGQSWTGLLVANPCVSGNSKEGASASGREADLTVNGRTTTPAVDAAGTRGSADPTTDTPSTKMNEPQTGDVLATPTHSTERGWAGARRQAMALPAACIVNADTRSFALLLPDRSVLVFDTLAGEKIAAQLPAFPVNGKPRRVMRVYVTGKMQNGKIALDSIRM